MNDSNLSDLQRFKCELDLLLESKQFNSAIELINIEIQKQPLSTQLWIIRGASFHRLAEYKEAVLSFSKALELDFSSKEAALCLAIVYCEIGQYQEAEEIIEDFSNHHQSLQKSSNMQSLECAQDIANMHFKLSNLYLISGQQQECLNEIKRGLNADPTNIEGITLLSKSLLRSNQVQGALKVLSDALVKYPDNSVILNLLGIICYQEKNIEKSKVYFEKSMNLKSSNLIGNIYLRLCQ